MSELAIQDTPETFEERVETALYTMSNAAGSYDEDSRFSTIRRAMQNGRVPNLLSDHTNDQPEGYDNYAWQIVVAELRKCVLMSPDEIKERREELKEKENPVTTSDGGKGQWEFGRQRCLDAVNWLLTGKVDE